jgi:branched-chain amino acid transport system substrate-binding protein
MKAGAATSVALSLAGCALLGQSGDDTTNNNNNGGGIPDEPVKMGLTAFLSGPAAVTGEPMRNAAELVVDQINNEGGILGEREIDLTIIDEVAQGGGERYREFAENDTDVVIGYGSTSNANEVAPLASDLEQLTIFNDTGSIELFEDVVSEPEYAFRTCPAASYEAIVNARTIAQYLTDVETVATISPDYGYGRTLHQMFMDGLGQLAPDVEEVESRFTPLLQVNDFTPHLQALEEADPDFILTPYWGGDLLGFIEQGKEAGLFEDRYVSSMAAGMFADHPELVPEGFLGWGRGPGFPFMNDINPEREEFVNAYVDRFDGPPFSHTAYHAYEAIMTYVTAVEKGYSILGSWPTTEEIIHAMENIGMFSASGHSPSLTRKNGHQAVQPGYIGFVTRHEEYGSTYKDEIWFPAEHVNPPVGMNHDEWISQLEQVR